MYVCFFLSSVSFVLFPTHHLHVNIQIEFLQAPNHKHFLPPTTVPTAANSISLTKKGNTGKARQLIAELAHSHSGLSEDKRRGIDHMALGKEIVGLPLIERASLLPASMMRWQSGPAHVPLKQGWKRRKAWGKGVRAAISEDLVKSVSPTPPEKGMAAPAASSAKLKVRAVVTVRQKNKEDVKETIVKHLDAFTDKIGRNVVLQLVSTEVDPSKFLGSIFSHAFLCYHPSFSEFFLAIASSLFSCLPFLVSSLEITRFGE